MVLWSGCTRSNILPMCFFLPTLYPSFLTYIMPPSLSSIPSFLPSVLLPPYHVSLPPYQVGYPPFNYMCLSLPTMCPPSLPSIPVPPFYVCLSQSPSLPCVPPYVYPSLPCVFFYRVSLSPYLYPSLPTYIPPASFPFPLVPPFCVSRSLPSDPPYQVPLPCSLLGICVSPSRPCVRPCVPPPYQVSLPYQIPPPYQVSILPTRCASLPTRCPSCPSSCLWVPLSLLCVPPFLSSSPPPLPYYAMSLPPCFSPY